MSVEKKNKREEQRQRAQARARSARLRTMLIIAVGAGLIVFALVWQQVKPITGIVAPQIEAKPFADGNSMGDPNAPIQITEYSDFQCPFCERYFNETEPLFIENFIKTGKVFFTYRSAGNFVSDNLGGVNSESENAAAAAYCAADQGKFWEMHAAIFANNLDVENQGALAPRRLAAMAEAIGLDMTTYNECFDSDKHKARVEQDAADFEAIETGDSKGTPFFVVTYTVNGEVRTEFINGAQPIGEFQRIIEAALLIADK